MFVLSPALNTFPVVDFSTVYKISKSSNITYPGEVNTSITTIRRLLAMCSRMCNKESCIPGKVFVMNSSLKILNKK